MKVVECLLLDGYDEGVGRLLNELGFSSRAFGDFESRAPVVVVAGDGMTLSQELQLKGVDPSRVVAICPDPSGLPSGCLWLTEEVLKTERGAALLNAWISGEGNDPVQGLLAQISHDMRAPLSVISTAASLIAKFGTDQLKTARYLELINESSGVLKSLVSDILDYSNIRQGEFAFSTTDFHLPQLLSSITESFRLLVKHPEQLSVECRLDDSLPEFVHGDPGRLRQVLTNLMNNALKFTDSGAVELLASSREGRLDFSVVDTGIGIPPEALHRIFLPYQQADRNIHANFGGTGLGLTICRALVHRMNGEIGVESTLGKGSRFWFTSTLPTVVVKPVAELPELKGTRVLVGSGNTNLIPNWMNEAVALSLATSQGEMESALIRGGVDLCIIDLDLGQWEFVRQVAERGESFPLVVMTAVGQRGDVALCKELGVSGYLTAPLDKSEIETALALVLSGANHDIVTKYTAKEFLSSKS